MLLHFALIAFDALKITIILMSLIANTDKAKLRRKKIAQRRRKRSELMPDSLQLASLPGISAFADRALIGFLKSYATIHRDKKMQSWKNDFRLGAGVGAFSVDMMFGMDAGEFYAYVYYYGLFVFPCLSMKSSIMIRSFLNH